MALTKIQKEKVIKDLTEKINKQKSLIFIDFTGLKVKDLSVLRSKIKKVSADLKVAKKTLLSLVLKEKGLKVEKDKLNGEIALVFGYGDQVLPAKTIYEFSQSNPNVKILGGFLENEFKEAEVMINLAQLPGRQELLAKLVGSIASPISGLVNVLQGNIRDLVYVISQIKPKT